MHLVNYLAALFRNISAIMKSSFTGMPFDGGGASDELANF